jgi:Periplasmic binding protein
MTLRQWLTRTLALISTLALALVVGCWEAGPAGADHTIKIGGQCDRTGPVKLIGVEQCPGITDYVKLVNKQGGVMGHRLEYTEIEHGYSVDRGVESSMKPGQHSPASSAHGRDAAAVGPSRRREGLSRRCSSIVLA